MTVADELKYTDLIAQNFSKLPLRAQSLIFWSLTNIDNQNLMKTALDWLITEDFEYYMDLKSPIEVIFGITYDLMLHEIGFPDTEYLYLDSQKQIISNGNTYYADFCVDAEPDEWFDLNEYHLIIECDGHDFHEKTKKQVEKRNQRDFDLKMAGYDIIHFSGSEIFNDPYGCALKVVKLIKANVGEIKRNDNGNI